MTDHYTSRALQALREDQVRLTADHEVKKEELREVQKALNGVRKAIAALDPDRSSGGGVSSVDLVDEMKRYLGENPDSDDNEVRQHMERYVR